MLSVLGGIAGLGVAYLGVKAIVALAFHGAKYVPIDAAPSLPVLGFAFGCRWSPACSSERRRRGLRRAPIRRRRCAAPTAARGTAPRSRRKILVIVQATLSVVLLAGAGLLTRSLQKLQHQDFGYEMDHRVTISLTAPFSSYPQPKLDAMYRELQDRLSHIPGRRTGCACAVHAASGQLGRDRHSPGPRHAEHERDIGSSWDHVNPGYLETLGRAHYPRAQPHRTGHRDHAECCRGQRSLCEAVLQARRRARRARTSASICRNTATPTRLSGVVRNAKYNDPANTEPPRPLFFVPLAQRVAL